LLDLRFRVTIGIMRESKVVKRQVDPRRPKLAAVWITASQYAELHSMSKQTLANWRYADLRAGRQEAAPGYPKYRRFGGSVRYLRDDIDTDTAA
jgi:hypothetical protein